MKYLVVHTSLLMCLFLVSCAAQPADAQTEEPEFRVRAKNADDVITLLDENFQTIIDIHSDFGLGTAAFDLTSGNMPQTIVVRLHLKGLEDFRVISTEATVGASVSTGEAGFPVRERIVSSSVEFPILSLHPLWMTVNTVSESASIPLEDGYFEITIPPGFLRGAGKSFEIQWIDFYR